jgi:hypothetical protein
MTTATVSKAAQKRAERDKAKESLASNYLKPGDKVYTVIRSVSASGMSRTMSLYAVIDGQLFNITYNAAKALDYPLVDVNGSRVMRVGGCGMDMGFHAVYSLSSYLFRDLNLEGDPGYLLKQEWI